MTIASVNFRKDEVWALESPLETVEGISVTFSCTYLGVIDVGDPTVKVYKNKSDVTSTVMPSGSVSSPGNVAILKPLTALVGTNRYVVSVKAVADGITEVHNIMLIVAKDKTEQ